MAAQEQVNASIMHVLGPVLTPYMDCLEAVMAQYAQDGDDVQMSQDLFADADSVTVLRSTLQECLASLRYFLFLLLSEHLFIINMWICRIYVDL